MTSEQEQRIKALEAELEIAVKSREVILDSLRLMVTYARIAYREWDEGVGDHKTGKRPALAGLNPGYYPGTDLLHKLLALADIGQAKGPQVPSEPAAPPTD